VVKSKEESPKSKEKMESGEKENGNRKNVSKLGFSSLDQFVQHCVYFLGYFDQLRCFLMFDCACRHSDVQLSPQFGT